MSRTARPAQASISTSLTSAAGRICDVSPGLWTNWARRVRGGPSDLRVQLDWKTLENGSSFAFQTPFGVLDIFSNPAGAPRYDELRAAAGAPLDVDGIAIRVCSLDRLIAMKEAAGRPKPGRTGRGRR